MELVRQLFYGMEKIRSMIRTSLYEDSTRNSRQDVML